MNFPGEKGSVSFKILQLSKIVQKSEQTNDLFLRKMPKWWTVRYIDRQTDRQAGRQAGRQTDRHTDKG